MTPDPKAPLPDGVEKAIDFVSDAFRHEFREAKSDPDEPYFCALKTIRTHIAAQAEKIAKLEARVAVLQDAGIKMNRYNEARFQQNTLDAERIIALEADNKRLTDGYMQLREAAMMGLNALCHLASNVTMSQMKADYVGARIEDIYDITNKYKPLPALAQTAEPAKVCGTCGGTAIVPIVSKLNNYLPQYTPSPCPTCNGTGREVK